MSTDDKIYYDKKTVAQYLNMIGIDESEVKSSELKRISGKRLDYLGELYELTNADSLLLESSHELSSSYELLLAKLDNEYLFESKGEKEKAKEVALSLIKSISCIQVADYENEEFDPYTVFERTNVLLNTIISGIVLTDRYNIHYLNMMYMNMPPESLISLIKFGEDPIEVRKLFGLMALSKFKESEIDHNIFDIYDNISLSKLKATVKTLIEEKTPIETLDDIDDIYVSPNKKMVFQRPSFKQLKEAGDYRRM